MPCCRGSSNSAARPSTTARLLLLRSGTPHRTATGPSASSRPPRGLCATRPPWRFVACLPADLTEVGQCVSPSPASPSVLPEATTKLVRHARPPSLPSQPTPVVIACPREEAEHRRGVRGEPSNVTNGLLSPVSRRCRAQASLLLVPLRSSAASGNGTTRRAAPCRPKR